MSLHHDVHPAGFYGKYPAVTWDLARERWLGTRLPLTRHDLLMPKCLSCGWSGEPELVLMKPERRRVAEFIAEARHWYECPADPQVKCLWLNDLACGKFPAWEWPWKDEPGG
jgi:hypothetical protein